MTQKTGLFVTGTDTGVGKTLVSAALVRRLVQQGCSVGVMKPVETGVDAGPSDHSDAARLMAAAGSTDALDLMSPYRFSSPVAPLSAAMAQGQVIELGEIVRRYDELAARYPCVVVEGVGGLLVPMGRDWDIADLISRLGLPVVLVGRVGLGGINHALLTLESLERRRITVMALILNETAPSTTPIQQEQCASTIALLRDRITVPLLGPLPHEAGLDCRWDETVEQLAASRPISELAELARKTIVERA